MTRSGLTSEQHALLRREGLAKADAAKVREHADRHDDPERTEALHEIAHDLENAEPEPSKPTTGTGGAAPKSKPVKAPAPKRATRRGRRGPLGRILRRTSPERHVTGAVGSVSDLIWTYATFAMGALLLAVIVKHPKGFSGALATADGLIGDVVNPKALRGPQQTTKTATAPTVATRTGVLA